MLVLVCVLLVVVLLVVVLRVVVVLVLLVVVAGAGVGVNVGVDVGAGVVVVVAVVLVVFSSLFPIACCFLIFLPSLLSLGRAGRPAAANTRCGLGCGPLLPCTEFVGCDFGRVPTICLVSLVGRAPAQ